MKRFIDNIFKGGAIMVLAAASSSSIYAQMPGEALDPTSKILNIYDWTVFYDGYKTDEVVDADLSDGITRFTNYHYTKKLPLRSVLTLGEELQLEVLIGAMCDNYDRMGRVMLAFPPKGSASYDPSTVEKIEIARFITPFMSKNRNPDVVPYVYDINDVKQLLRDIYAIDEKDVWMEVELFGIPYDAQEKVAGCKGRNDVFNATISFGGRIDSDIAFMRPQEEVMKPDYNVLGIPVTVSKCEIHGNVNLNKYNAAATDTLGVTTKTYHYTVPRNVADAQLTLILTNHGAGENGEEYVRRKHLVYIDGELALVYTPGGVSCEPYRVYNTMGNYIYGSEPQDDWEEWNNWCPGQAVPSRRISLGAVKAGEHTLMIRVPEAEFYANDGDFRPSAWFMGVVSGEVAAPSEVTEISANEGVKLSFSGDIVKISDPASVKMLTVYSYDGRLLEGRYNPGAEFSMAGYGAGQYIVVAETQDGAVSFVKVMR